MECCRKYLRASLERLDNMRLNAKDEKNFKATSLALRSARQSIKTSKQYLTALSMGNGEEQQEDSTEQIDPTKYLSGREIHKWNQLPQSQKRRYIEDGIKVSKKNLKTRTGISNDRIDFTEEIEKSVASIYTSDLHHVEETVLQGIYELPIYDPKKNLQNRLRKYAKNNSNALDNTGTANGAITKLHSSTNPKVATDSQAASSVASMNTTQTSAISTGSASTSAVTTGTASTGAGIVVVAGKKAADKFKSYMQEHAMASEQAIRNVESKMQDIKKDNHEMDTLPTGIRYIGATIGTIFMSLVAVIVQAVFSLISVIVGVLIAVILPIIVVISIIAAILSIIAALLSNPISAGGGQRIVQIALQEENTTSGAKYWNFVMGGGFRNGDATPWCACFVSWCANEAGYIDDGIVPKSASVASYRRFYTEKGRFHSPGDYVPQAGDFICFGTDEHIGIVQYVENGRVITIEGNTSDAVHSRSYLLTSNYITGYCNPEYPAGSTMEIPDGMGTYHTYMGWRSITSPTSLQYQLRERSGEHYDREGFAIIDGRYVIACTTFYGQVGDYIDFYRENGDVLHCVIGDIKNQNDAGCNQYGHANGRCVVEFVVNQSMWYPSHANPGTASCHPEWNSRIVKAVNTGYNYLQH